MAKTVTSPRSTMTAEPLDDPVAIIEDAGTKGSNVSGLYLTISGVVDAHNEITIGNFITLENVKENCVFRLIGSNFSLDPNGSLTITSDTLDLLCTGFVDWRLK